MLNKKEVIEMLYRPQPVPSDIMPDILNFWMRSTPHEIMMEFKRSTNLTLVYSGQGLFEIKY